MDNLWDKVFEKSENVQHQKVSFCNRYGIKLVANMFVPKTNQKNIFNAKI